MKTWEIVYVVPRCEKRQTIYVTAEKVWFDRTDARSFHLHVDKALITFPGEFWAIVEVQKVSDPS